MAVTTLTEGWGLDLALRPASSRVIVVPGQRSAAVRSALIRARAKRQVASAAERRARHGTHASTLYLREARRMRVEANGYDLDARQIASI